MQTSVDIWSQLYNQILSITVPFSDELISKFEEWYSNKVKGKNTVRYTVKYVKEFGWLLNTDRMTFISTLAKDSRRSYILDALSNYCKFLDDYFNTDIYHRKFEFLKKGLKRSKERKFTGFAPSLEDLVKIYEALVEYGYSGAIDYFRTMLFTGCRTGEARLIVKRIHENKFFIVNGDTVVVHVWKVTGIKNLYISLMPVELLEILRKRKGLGKKYEVYKAFKYAREKTGLTSWTPYSLRDFFATWMRGHGMSRDDIELIQGRLPHKAVLEERYLDLRSPDSPYLRTLCRIYRNAVQELIPLFIGSLINQIER